MAGNPVLKIAWILLLSIIAMNRPGGIASLRPLHVASLQDEIHSALRDAITDGQLPPGERLRELELARHFGTSQAPVREALRRLAQEGLVVTVPYRGTFVTRLSIEEMREVYSLRAEVECWAVRRFVERATPRDVALLQVCVAAMRAAGARGDLAGFSQADVQFHETICNVAGNRLLPELWSLIDARVRGMMAFAHRLFEQDLPRIADLHAPIADALASRDRDEAERQTRLHMHYVWDTIKDKIVQAMATSASEEDTTRPPLLRSRQDRALRRRQHRTTAAEPVR